MQKLALFVLQFVFKVLSLISPRLAGKWSFRLSYYPRTKSKVRAHEIEIMAHAKQAFIEVNDKKVVIYSWGSGQPVLLVHGHESRASRFTPFVNKLLEHGYSPISFDAPGHGDSGGKDTNILEYQKVIKQIEQLYGQFACIVAHSVGVLCSFYAVKEGVKSEKIVAISGVCQLSYITNKIASTLKLSQYVLEDLNTRLESLFATTSNVWRRFSADNIDAPLNSDILIIHDINDSIVDYEQSQRLHSCHSPIAPMITTKGLGHRRILSDHKVIDSVVAFIQGA